MKKEEYLYAIESILFVSPKPVKIDKLASKLLLDKGSVNELLLGLEAMLKNTGINLQFDGNKVFLAPNPNYKKFYSDFIKKKKVTLSRSLLEVIGLLLKKKRTKEEIDKIRGVNSARAINDLLKYGYIEKEYFEGKIFYKVSQKFYEKLPQEVKENLIKKMFI